MIPTATFTIGMVLSIVALVWLFHDYVPERPETQGWD